ncbi:MAG: HAD family hydrolase [Clostridia bacterium]|nr:HAD family hydrolase [Clostridia bacterium]
MSKKYKAVIFDLDGTLLDTAQDLASSVNYVLEKYGFSTRSVEDIIAFTGNGIKALLHRAMESALDDKLCDSMIKDFKAHYLTHADVHTTPYEGIYELLDALLEKGYTLAVVSNKVHEASQRLCNKFFEGYFATVVGDMPNVAKKPADGTIRLALDKLGCTMDEIIYIGDSEVDFYTHQNTGMDLVLGTWGFRDENYLRSLGATRLAARPADVLKFIE